MVKLVISLMPSQGPRVPSRTPTQPVISAVAQGQRFQDAVEKLYRVLGADVTQNIMICEKKVDLLAVFHLPGGSNDHRVIVECKDERKGVAQNQRVMHLKGLLEVARKSGEADSAEIVTRVPWGDAAKGFARQAGIGILTYREKLAKLIDFEPYLERLVRRFDKGIPERPNDPPLGSYFVEPRIERDQRSKLQGEAMRTRPSLSESIRSWCDEEKGKKQLVILGEFGTGKTSICQKLARDFAADYLRNPGSVRLPDRKSVV
jgi:hypothetical protein